MSFEEFQDGSPGGHLGYRNGTILAILNLCVTMMPPIKFQLNRTGFGRRCCLKNFKMAAPGSSQKYDLLSAYFTNRVTRMLRKGICVYKEIWRLYTTDRLYVQCVAKDPSFLHADSEDSDQIGLSGLTIRPSLLNL